MLVYKTLWVVLLLLAFHCSGQFIDPASGIHPNTYSKPRNKLDADSAGHYELITQLNVAEIEPGEALVIEMYMSGYGNIGGNKIVIERLPPIFILDSPYSFTYVLQYHTIGELNGQPVSQLYYPMHSIPTPFIVTFAGAQAPNWKQPTHYLDADTSEGGGLQIIPETATLRAPFTVQLATKKGIKPGVYSFPVTYTYFNGQKWAGEQQFVTFKVKDYTERNSTWITVLGLILAFIAIIPLLADQSKKIINRLRSALGYLWRIYLNRMRAP